MLNELLVRKDIYAFNPHITNLRYRVTLCEHSLHIDTMFDKGLHVSNSRRQRRGPFSMPSTHLYLPRERVTKLLKLLKEQYQIVQLPIREVYPL